MNKQCIIFENVNKSFGEKLVLKDFNQVFSCGSKTCIMGESGRGKTTLLKLIMGLENPDSGVISGVPKKISAVFQEDRLCESFSAIGNIKAVVGNKVSEQDINHCLAELGLDGNEYAPVTTLSGGMRRRVALARALLAESDILLLDEPFGGLDIDTKNKVIDVILKYLNNRTLLMVTHDVADAELLSADIINI